MRKPDFLLIGGQKCGTTWAWRMIESHPGTDLPEKKEIHYFGGVENYKKGKQWYYSHFSNIDKDKVTGEASTTYLYDRMPFWHNDSNKIEYDDDLPSIPEIVRSELPDVKIIAILRNPVARAKSAYLHVLRVAARNHLVRDEMLKVWWSLKKIALDAPKTRILEYGFYHKHLSEWYRVFPKEQIRVYIYEDDLLPNPMMVLKDLYGFLDLDSSHVPEDIVKKYNISWGIASIFLTYFLPGGLKSRGHNKITRFLDNSAIASKALEYQIDDDFLKMQYAEEKEKLEHLLGRPISWDYS